MDGRAGSQDNEVAVARALTALRNRAAADAAFAAQVQPDGKAMRILQVCGGLTQSLSGLTITSGAGLGGKALVLGRPARVNDYLSAQGITHNYDHAVQQEQLRTVAAIPVRLGDTPRYVVYVGARGEKWLGDGWLDAMGSILRDLEQDVAVNVEVERRLNSLVPPVPAQRDSELSAGDLREIAGELAELASSVTDEALRGRLAALHDRFAPGEHEELLQRERPDVGLTPQEIAVVKQVALGGTNVEVAQALGLLPNTVKSYLKAAMRKLGATNRVQATVRARSLGILP